MDQIARLWGRLCELPGVEESSSSFSSRPALWVGRHEIAHPDGPDAIDIRLTRDVIRARRPELAIDPAVELRRSTSDWVTVRLGPAADADTFARLVTELVLAAAAAHAARPGAGDQPPDDAELRRRRRFH